MSDAVALNAMDINPDLYPQVDFFERPKRASKVTGSLLANAHDQNGPLKGLTWTLKLKPNICYISLYIVHTFNHTFPVVLDRFVCMVNFKWPLGLINSWNKKLITPGVTRFSNIRVKSWLELPHWGQQPVYSPPPHPHPQLAMWTDSGMAWQLFVVFNCLKSHNYNVHVQITTGFFFS